MAYLEQGAKLLDCESDADRRLRYRSFRVLETIGLTTCRSIDRPAPPGRSAIHLLMIVPPVVARARGPPQWELAIAPIAPIAPIPDWADTPLPVPDFDFDQL